MLTSNYSQIEVVSFAFPKRGRLELIHKPAGHSLNISTASSAQEIKN